MAFWRPGERLPSLHGDAGGAEERDGARVDAEAPAVLYNPNHRLPLRAQRQQLPVFAHRREILYAVESYATTILVGATGSGKTTQVPQYLMEAGWAQKRRNGDGTPRMIACTQPRRIAAITIAERVAKEVGTPLGKEVGYAVRFDEKWDPETTQLKFCTDGMLLRETMLDPLLSRYSVIMLDEAHERNLETDLLLGLIKKIQRKRPELRVIIASATLQVDTFTRFFRSKKRKLPEEKTEKAASIGDVIAVSVEGRQYPVDIEYLREPCGDYLEKTIETVLAIDKHEGNGDILVFLPGQDEIEYVVRTLHDRAASHLIALPLYATLPAQMQQNVFLPAPRNISRKVIVATTIAETSVTIEGVVFVVDSCFVKLAFFNPFTGVESLLTTQVSKASAKQRAGRAGRVRPGKCFRLCTQEHFETQLSKETIPQMQRTNLASVALHLLSMGIQDIAHFEFVSPPSPEALIRALEVLYSLGAVDEQCRLIEPLGTQMAEFPVAPMLAKVLLSSFQFGCTDEVLTIASMLSVGDVFMNPRGSKDRRAKISEAMSEFAEAEGDHLMYLKIYDEFIDNGRRRDWCDEHMLQFQALTRATEIRKHLKRYVKRFQVVSGAGNTEQTGLDDNDDVKTSILKCFVSGFFSNAAKLRADGVFRTIRDNRVVQIHPTSVFYHMGRVPDWIIFHQSVLTTDEYIRDISKIDPRWLVSLAPDFYRTRDVSTAISGSSGDVGLPKATPVVPKKAAKTGSNGDATPATSADGRILFRKPTSRSKDGGSKPKLPVHIGKSKGGLRSQF
ncbi:hypothetical protein Poli38472_010078 [Pythium oligandrum]|uniref:RNA helicase n=1 Tax=Pythium oligandrum TaxID=41045 RepID=A0A8K1C8P6_PYTOL|nr:hypothetical protein Poli38472_010078 [Pythium oligandrum]|eukprot:TMW58519.1 hypothetical protein Poli38472_010078 [Pythium oligandrum]